MIRKARSKSALLLFIPNPMPELVQPVAPRCLSGVARRMVWVRRHLSRSAPRQSHGLLRTGAATGGGEIAQHQQAPESLLRKRQRMNTNLFGNFSPWGRDGGHIDGIARPVCVTSRPNSDPAEESRTTAGARCVSAATRPRPRGQAGPGPHELGGGERQAARSLTAAIRCGASHRDFGAGPTQLASLKSE
jgi:hypothetical protein